MPERQLTRHLPSTHKRQLITLITALWSILELLENGEWVQMLFFAPLCSAMRFARRFDVGRCRGGMRGDHGEGISGWPSAQFNALLLQFHLHQLILLLDLFFLVYYFIEPIADGLIALLLILELIA